MSMLSQQDYMGDAKSHCYWWTWIPAWPLSRDDIWYDILWQVFADNTTPVHYREGCEDHQTVGIFQSFSAIAPSMWVPPLLRACKIEFEAPVRDVRWQYQLISGSHMPMADIALIVTDARGRDDELAIVFEAKRRSKRPSDRLLEGKDLAPGYYIGMPQLEHLKRPPTMRFLIDKGDVPKFSRELPAGDAPLTWQDVARIQIDAFEQLDLQDGTKRHLLALMRSHLRWYDDPATVNGFSISEPFSDPELDFNYPRIGALIRGAETVLRARKRLPVSSPPGFESEALAEIFQ